MRLPNQKAPCRDCPFRTDALPGWLGAERMREILAARTFVCHKKTQLQCAGHMLIKGEENDFVQLAARLGLDTGLKGRALVFETEQACINRHENAADAREKRQRHTPRS